MSKGLESALNILERSPHDFSTGSGCTASPEPEQPKRWVPSRYNIRAKASDGRLILWNSYSRAMNVFGAENRSAIERMLSQKGFTATPGRMAKYLIDRGYLLQEGTDEYRRIQMAHGRTQFRSDRLELTLLASEDCNFRCQYCYEEFARGTMLPEVRQGIKELIRSRTNSLKTLSVSWFGGEPLYGMEAITDLAPFLTEFARENGISYTSGMTTNAYLLSPEVADKLLEWDIRRYQITIDGPEAYHDTNRPTRNGCPTFETIFSNLEALALRTDDFDVTIRVNWDLRNHPHLTELVQIVDDRLQRDSRFRLRFHPIFSPGTPNDEMLDICGADEQDALQHEIEAAARERGILKEEKLQEVVGVGSGVCYAARPYHFIIGATGKIMKCTVELDMKDRNVVGQVASDGALDLDQDKMALWCEPAFEKDSKCQKCTILPICMGSSCPIVRFNSGKSPCIPLRHGTKRELRRIAETQEF